MLGRIADLTWQRPKLVLAVVAILAIAAGAIGRDVEHRLKAAGFTDSASQGERATRTLRAALGYDANPGIVVLVRARGGGRLDVTSRAVRRDVARLAREIAEAKHVGRVIDPLANRREGAGLIARDGRSLVLSVHLAVQDVEDAGGVASADVKRRIAGTRRLDVGVGGFAPSFDEVNDQTREDLTNAELIAFPALTILLLLVFRGVVAAAIPLLIGALSVIGTLFVLRVTASLVDTSLFALNIATALGLGLAVDYALLLVSRYREELAHDGGATRAAHRRTVLGAGRAAVFSGFTVAVALASLVVLPQRFLYSLGIAGAAVATLSAVLTVLVVPSLLAIAGTRINALAIRRGPSVASESGRWYALARGVMRRPVLVALASAGLLLAASAPLLGTTLTGPSGQAVPPGQPAYAVNEYLEDHYPRAVTEAATVTIRGAADLQQVRRRIAATPGVVSVPPLRRASRSVAFTNVGMRAPALDARSQDTVRAIRDLPAGDRAEILVSGTTARHIDQKESLVEHAPLTIGLVVLSTVVLLFLLTGSVVLPLKTLLMNTLTLTATLGILVLAFQEGWLHAPLDYSGPQAIEVTSLVFLFAVTFGLATDYAVLVMARIKEERDLGASNERAVAVGIGRTGRIITAAALMISVVFLAFAVSPVFFMKQIAIGMAVGVLIDTTIVRALLVPALMRLFGEWNWWAPRPLARLQARFGIREA